MSNSPRQELKAARAELISYCSNQAEEAYKLLEVWQATVIYIPKLGKRASNYSKTDYHKNRRGGETDWFFENLHPYEQLRLWRKWIVQGGSSCDEIATWNNREVDSLFEEWVKLTRVIDVAAVIAKSRNPAGYVAYGGYSADDLFSGAPYRISELMGTTESALEYLANHRITEALSMDTEEREYRLGQLSDSAQWAWKRSKNTTGLIELESVCGELKELTDRRNELMMSLVLQRNEPLRLLGELSGLTAPTVNKIIREEFYARYGELDQAEIF